MWFKNLQLYRLTSPLEHTPEALHALFVDRAFHPVGKQQLSSAGWVPPLGEAGEQLVHAASGRLLICLRHEERVLPAATVREALEARIADIEAKTSRKVRGQARSELKDEVIRDLLPRAFTRSRLTRAYIDPVVGWLVIDAASPRKAEEVTRLLRESLGSLPVKPLEVAEAPDAVMTAWLASGRTPEGFVIGQECDLTEPGEGGAQIRVRRQDLSSDEIHGHLEAGKRVSRLALELDERIAFVVDEQMAIKRLRFLDLIQDEAAAVATETEAERLDADFAIMSLELASLIPKLIEAFGGHAEDEARNAA